MNNGDAMPYRLDADVIRRITEANNIVDVIEEFIPLKKAGANFNACCPFHREKTPSFVVSPEKQIYHCFGCGESGDSIQFLMKYKNDTFVEAAEYLARRAGIVLEEVADSEVRKNKNLMYDKLYLINREAALFFYSSLKRCPLAVNYLNTRKIDKNVIKRFGIGYANNEWDYLLKYLKSKGFVEEDILSTGLIIKNEKKNSYYDRFRNRIMFPIFDIKKRIIGFGGRVLDDSLPKYLNSPESLIFSKGSNLYGIHIAKEAVRDKSFILVEGYMDVIKMHVYGYDTTVAALGTALTDNQINLMKRYSKNFYVSFDADKAGRQAALKAMNMFKRNNLDGKAVIIPEAKDPDEFLNKFGKSKFDKVIENALDYYSFLEFFYRDVYENSDKVEYINKFFENIVNVNSEIERELIFEKLSEKMGVSKESIFREYAKRNTKLNISRPVDAVQTVMPKPAQKMQIQKITTSHEDEIIKLILYNNDLALYLKEIVNEDTFSDLSYYHVFKTMYDYRLAERSIDKGTITGILKDKGMTGDFENNDDVDFNNLEALFRDCLKRLKIKYYEEKKIKISENMKLSQNKDEKERMAREIFDLARKIKSTKEEVS